MAKTNKIHNKIKKAQNNQSVAVSLSARQRESVITRIIEQSNYRSRKDIADWRRAINMAENKEMPRRIMLLNLYDDIVLDNHLYAQIQSRVLRVLGLPFKVADNISKKEINDKTDLLLKQWFYKFINFSMQSILYGHSLIQIDSVINNEIDSISLVPRRHVRPELGIYCIKQLDDSGIKYRTPEYSSWLLEVGDSYDLGLLMKAVPNVLWKKNAQMCWSEYCEIFGMPLRVGKTNTRSNDDLDRIESQLQRMGSAAYAVLQAGETVEFIESTKGDAYNVYNQLVERCNSEISKLILGQTLTSDTGKSGTRAQGEVHERVADAITRADIMFIEHVVNDKLIPVLIAQGYPLQNCYFEFVIKQEITALDWTIDSGLLAQFEIDPQYFIDKYSVPIIAKKETTPKLPSGDSNEDDKKDLSAKAEFQKIVNLHAAIDKMYNGSECCEHE